MANSNLRPVYKINWDALGISASVLCAIHCAVLPLIMTSLPLFGINIIENTFFEYIMIGVAFLIGAYSLMHGWRKHHHKLWPVIIFTLGMLCLIAKQALHQYHIIFLIPAVMLIVGAHFYNYRLCRKAHHCHDDDCAHQ